MNEVWVAIKGELETLKVADDPDKGELNMQVEEREGRQYMTIAWRNGDTHIWNFLHTRMPDDIAICRRVEIEPEDKDA